MMQPIFSITLPYPPKELNPNARVHHLKKNNFFQQAKTVAFVYAQAECCKGEGFPKIGKNEKLQISYIFYPPDFRKRDIDNALSSCKAYQDGICQVLQINDQQINVTIIQWGEKRKGGEVSIELARSKDIEKLQKWYNGDAPH